MPRRRPRSSSSKSGTVGELQAAMAEGSQTARSLVEAYVARIEAVDRSGPAGQLGHRAQSGTRSRSPARSTRSVLPGTCAGRCTAFRSSSRTTSTRRTGCRRPPGRWRWRARSLSGTPGWSRACGRPAPYCSARPICRSGPTSAPSARRAAGAGGGGQTRNPYALDRNPCGSSSGSGAAASANLCALAVGTETNGSVVCPSTANGLVGIKPSLGLVSRSGSSRSPTVRTPPVRWRAR